MDDKVQVLKETSSGVAGKHRQGGQSAKRFQKLREMELTYYFNRIAQITREYFIVIYPILFDSMFFFFMMADSCC